jgi:iron complex transport system substrate-binding protein
MQGIEAQAGQIDDRPSVACIEWIDPLMAAGNWMPELVAMAGGENVFGEAGRHSPWMTWESFCHTDPDVILILPCGYNINESRRNIPVLTRRPEWPDLSAVTTGRVFLADGNQYFNRPGPRLAESLEILAELLHPEVFNFGHEGVGWERL